MKLDHRINKKVFIDLLEEYLNDKTIKKTCKKYNIKINKGRYILFAMYDGWYNDIRDKFKPEYYPSTNLRS